MRRRWQTLLLIMVLFVTGCANIPDESTPRPIQDDQPQISDTIEQPTRNLNAFDLVREFVHKSGNPNAAKLYLTKQARSKWPVGEQPLIIHDTYSTVPRQTGGDKQTGEDQGGVENTKVTVQLRVTMLGRLDDDAAIVPAVGPEEFDVEVVLEGGQWRIDKPPERVILPQSDFNAAYRDVTLYFFDPDQRVTVPDLRYVAADPISGLPERVISVLLKGPSKGMIGSVRSPLAGVATNTNVVPDPDGTLVVDLIPLGDKTPRQREQIAAQIVLSLQTVTTSRLRIKGDGQDLIPGHGDWRLGDLKAYDAATKLNPDDRGLIVSGNQLRFLSDGRAVPGPTGNGEYDVVSAAQSMDGRQLAAVTMEDGKLRLRIGPFGQPMEEVALEASTMTRPTWRIETSPDQESREVWTVEDGNVVRVVRSGDETWKSVEVSASALDTYGTITQLRLSRDGTRAAMIISGRLVVAAVVRTEDGSVSLVNPKRLQENMILYGVSVDWYNQQTLVVATEQTTLPVVNVSVDGHTIESYDPNNLQPPLKAVTAAPDREIVVTDSAGVSAVPGLGQIWRPMQNGQGPAAVPFYPG